MTPPLINQSVAGQTYCFRSTTSCAWVSVVCQCHPKATWLWTDISPPMCGSVHRLAKTRLLQQTAHALETRYRSPCALTTNSTLQASMTCFPPCLTLLSGDPAYKAFSSPHAPVLEATSVSLYTTACSTHSRIQLLFDILPTKIYKYVILPMVQRRRVLPEVHPPANLPLYGTAKLPSWPFASYQRTLATGLVARDTTPESFTILSK